MHPSKVQRWLDLIVLLIGRGVPLGIDDIMRQVPAYRERWLDGDQRARASVRRMFERDKDELRGLGVPLETRRFAARGMEEIDGYLIPRGEFYLPYLQLVQAAGDEPSGSGEGDEKGAPSTTVGPARAPGAVTLTEEEARIAVLALRGVLSLPSFPFGADARRALRKLTFDLASGLDTPEGDPKDGMGPIRILERPGGADPEGVLRTLLDALYDRRRTEFRYHSMGRDEVRDRKVAPWGLLFQWGAWYLVGADLEAIEDENSGSARLFRLDRMSDARARGRTGAVHVPADFELRDLMGRRAWELADSGGDMNEVQVAFRPAAARLAARNGWGELLEVGTGGVELRSFTVHRLDPFLRWVLSLAGDARVVAPAEAAGAFTELARSVWIGHGGKEA
jgi:proteasome accessory factor B